MLEVNMFLLIWLIFIITPNQYSGKASDQWDTTEVLVVSRIRQWNEIPVKGLTTFPYTSYIFFFFSNLNMVFFHMDILLTGV